MKQIVVYYIEEHKTFSYIFDEECCVEVAEGVSEKAEILYEWYLFNNVAESRLLEETPFSSIEGILTESIDKINDLYVERFRHK